MGVKGLWQLLNPVARPVKIETLEGKRLAIDSSIWLYQFQATMKDKEGQTLVNAHVLGFLRRINKLLFHGIKPVFVFDGGAPALKRSTIAERKRRKQGGVADHAQTAEKILNLQLRQAAVRQAQERRLLKRTTSGRTDKSANGDYGLPSDAEEIQEDDTGDRITSSTVFLDDLSAPHIHHRTSSSSSVFPNGQQNAEAGPSRPRSASHASADSQRSPTRSLSPVKAGDQPPKKKKYVRHDPYELPQLPKPSMHPSAVNDKPDERLLTDEELREYIEEIKATHLDVTSPDFLALPPEVQYELTNDARVQSRAPNHRRTALMVQRSTNALEFSKAQIANLKVRNNLTQRMWGLAGVEGGLVAEGGRIAGEKGREYTLLKNETTGGWSLGVRNEGTEAKPIDLVEEEEFEGSDDGLDGEGRPKKKRRMIRGGVLVTLNSDGEEDEVQFHRMQPTQPVDEDFAAEKRQNALNALAARYSPAKPAKVRKQPQCFAPPRAPEAPPLFEIESSSAEDSDDGAVMEEVRLDEDEDEDLQRAIEFSARDAARASIEAELEDDPADQDDDDDLQAVLGLRRESAFRVRLNSPDPVSLPQVGVAQPQPASPEQVSEEDESEDEMEEIHFPTPTKPEALKPASTVSKVISLESDEEEDLQEVALPPSHTVALPPSPTPSLPLSSVPPVSTEASGSATSVPADAPLTVVTPALKNDHVPQPPPVDRPLSRQLAEPPVRTRPSAMLPPPLPPVVTSTERSHQRAAPHQPFPPPKPAQALARPPPPVANILSPSPEPEVKETASNASISSVVSRPVLAPVAVQNSPLLPPVSGAQLTQDARTTVQRQHSPKKVTPPLSPSQPAEEEEDEEVDWSPSPPPMRVYHAESDVEAESDVDADEHSDDEGQVDTGAEQDNYAKFLAQVKGKDLQQVQDELSSELKNLNKQRKKQQGEGDENITQQMVAQIQMLLTSFGIPYMTAPMEAEAQCAELARLHLVDGIITDDSDVFLFGGKQCFKNLFNDSKYVEAYLATDIQRELVLDRDRLVTLAFLLGSDYTSGLVGVGYVTAMELMAEFPGEGDKGLIAFRTWWLKVQSGKDTAEDTNTKWKTAFKKKNSKSLHLDAGFPNSQVRSAYFEADVDSSDEPFSWALPDLHRLRSLLSGELSWPIQKVDDEVLPIVQRMARRSNGLFSDVNKQGTLDGFFDTSGGGMSVFAPKVRSGNQSKRLQAVVKRFRESAGALSTGGQATGGQTANKPVMFAVDEDSDSGSSSSESGSDVDVIPKKTVSRPARGGRGGGRGARGTTARGKATKRGTAGRGRGRNRSNPTPTSTRTSPTSQSLARSESATSSSTVVDRDSAQAELLDGLRAEDLAFDLDASSDEEEVPVRARPKPRPRTRRVDVLSSDDEGDEEREDGQGARKRARAASSDDDYAA